MVDNLFVAKELTKRELLSVLDEIPDDAFIYMTLADGTVVRPARVQIVYDVPEGEHPWCSIETTQSE